MERELLSICKKLLDYLNNSKDLKEERKKQILEVIRRSIFILLIELHKEDYMEIREEKLLKIS